MNIIGKNSLRNTRCAIVISHKGDVELFLATQSCEFK